MRAAFFAVALLACVVPAGATEYWDGYDDLSGERVEVVVRYDGRLDEGADIFVRYPARSSQEEASVSRVEFIGPSHARVCVRLRGGEHCFHVSR